MSDSAKIVRDHLSTNPMLRGCGRLVEDVPPKSLQRIVEQLQQGVEPQGLEYSCLLGRMEVPALLALFRVAYRMGAGAVAARAGRSEEELQQFEAGEILNLPREDVVLHLRALADELAAQTARTDLVFYRTMMRRKCDDVHALDDDALFAELHKCAAQYEASIEEEGARSDSCTSQ